MTVPIRPPKGGQGGAPTGAAIVMPPKSVVTSENLRASKGARFFERAVCGERAYLSNEDAFDKLRLMAGRPRTTGKRLAFPEPLASDFLDFRAANYNAAEMEVLREALRDHIDRRLDAEPELRNRFEAARRKRLGSNGDNIRVLPTVK